MFPLSFLNSSSNLPVAVSIGLVSLNSHRRRCRSYLCVLLSMLLVHILALSLVMHINRSATLRLILFTLTIMVFPFLAWPLFSFELYCRCPLCKVTKHFSGILTSEIPITSHTNHVSLSSSSSSCICSSRSRVLALQVAIFSLFTLFRRLIVTERFLPCVYGYMYYIILSSKCFQF